MLIFNGSWNNIEIPKDWKKTDVLPVFSKDKHDDLGK